MVAAAMIDSPISARAARGDLGGADGRGEMTDQRGGCVHVLDDVEPAQRLPCQPFGEGGAAFGGVAGHRGASSA